MSSKQAQIHIPGKGIVPVALAAALTAGSTIAMLEQQGFKVEAHYNQDHDLFVIKDDKNKIRKPVGFVSNSLIKFVPKELV